MIGIDKKSIKFLINDNEESKWINKWPLIIFAINRTDNVIGRIRFLTVSMITMKELSKIGEPKGTKWVINLLNLFNILKIINLNHKGKARYIVKIKCLETVNT